MNSEYFEPKIIDIKQKGDTVTIIKAQDISPILADNYELRKHTKQIWRSKRNNPVGEFVARIPEDVLKDWIAAGFVHDKCCECGCTPQLRRKMLFAMLNLNPKFKTTNKTL